jgi:phosphatidylserine/phosphatidylglycerophosphate/cardiolipin synthase-like enzyme
MTAPIIYPDQIRIWTDDIPRRFAELLRTSQPTNVYISSPWISEFPNSAIDLRKLLIQKNPSTIILTRPPRTNVAKSFLKELKKDTRTRIYVNNKLHAKIYVIDGPKHKYVVIGSSNFTQESRFNLELAIVFVGSDILTKRVIYAFLAYLKPACKPW